MPINPELRTFRPMRREQGKSWLVWRWMLEAHEARAAIQREAGRQGTAAISRAAHEFLNSFRR